MAVKYKGEICGRGGEKMARGEKKIWRKGTKGERGKYIKGGERRRCDRGKSRNMEKVGGNN